MWESAACQALRRVWERLSVASPSLVSSSNKNPESIAVRSVSSATRPTYVLITPARNEAQYIELTIKSMVAQTFPPLKWVIVSDGSTDGTDEIVSRYAAAKPWIELLRMPERAERHFAGKVHAFNAGYAKAKDLNPDVVGNLDADVSIEPEHFQYLLGKFGESPELGVGGSPFKEGSQQYDYRFSNIENVWGGCQLFRRECYEAIGGYTPVKGGGIDHIAVVSARMRGWKTRTFTDKVCIHHRQMNTAQQGALKAKFKLGAKDYSFGNHPVWELFRTLYQTTKPPFVLGGLALGAGYYWSMFGGKEISVSREVVAFTRREQMQRLKKFVTRS
jgi:poly-beta-1,6-N-acetyl-D-glucosamine synthase